MMQQARPLVKDEKDPRRGGRLLSPLRRRSQRRRPPWRLQDLTDLKELPDYEDGDYWDGEATRRPVDARGNPVYPPHAEELRGRPKRRRTLALDAEAQAVESTPPRQ